ncbi:MAG: queuosine precursor transporter, partial [Candidatus Roizmanbacteria bacterium]|nr:queuosine precursor transporter [Candidatus Roizmanbacteria bacterium]
GRERTRSIIRSGLVVIFLILLFSLLTTSLPPSTRFIESEQAYDRIFGLSVRIAAASLTAFTVAEFLDVLVFVRLRKRFGKKRLWLRNNVSNIISQFVDTTLFMTLAFYSMERGIGDNVLFLSSLIVPYWLLKSFMSVIETPFVYFGVNWLKREE